MEYRLAIGNIPAIFRYPNEGWTWVGGGITADGTYMGFGSGIGEIPDSMGPAGPTSDGEPIPGTQPPLFFDNGGAGNNIVQSNSDGNYVIPKGPPRLPNGIDPSVMRGDPFLPIFPGTDDYYWRGAGAGFGDDRSGSGGISKRELVPPPTENEAAKSSTVRNRRNRRVKRPAIPP
ncbi:hypothetical protein TWF506_001774 [Arthrobotrys conoides]|uniref:Uncharacterized protein n=1 Tax=Arthrobotrys conoides TaxID=74498 RepID=A0AAN8P3B2_9PEZI